MATDSLTQLIMVSSIRNSCERYLYILVITRTISIIHMMQHFVFFLFTFYFIVIPDFVIFFFICHCYSVAHLCPKAFFYCTILVNWWPLKTFPPDANIHKAVFAIIQLFKLFSIILVSLLFPFFHVSIIFFHFI